MMTQDTKPQAKQKDSYTPHSFESWWQEKWTEEGIYRAEAESDKKKFYQLEFFPYPSGNGLSVGHSKNYVPCDSFCRYMRMQGYNVLHPMGWDSFGLPAENEAIIRNIHPQENTAKNAANYKRQMDLQGLSYDWSREIAASDPSYYKWTQWFFLLMHERGLAYRTKAAQWWCPKCQTILANEQVENGYCWRHGDQLVEKKELEQWYFRITDYAEELLKSLDGLDWPESIVAMQRNWIGKSEGAEIEFEAETADGRSVSIPVFTTRPDTVFGATFLVLSPEHRDVERLTSTEHRDRVIQYQQVAGRETEIARLSTDRDKTGVPTGAHALNPFTGERMPIWIADYVLMTYGKGAIMAVPGHDERDHAFASKYHLPIRIVIEAPDDGGGVFTGDGPMVNSAEFSGRHSSEARHEIIRRLEAMGIGKGTITYRMRDWLVSRQRYWGAPIPIVYCDQCGIVPVPADQLPVLLPRMEEYEPAGDGRSPLATVPDFVNTICPTCGGPARRETDTLDTFVDSSWYYLRYCSPHDPDKPFERSSVDYWAPLDLYVGGAEHAVMHLLYFRFFAKVMNDSGLVGFREPAPKLRNQGSMHGHDGQRMSKSKGNVVTPDSVVAKYSGDCLRAYVMFMGPFEANADWDEKSINGVWRWLNRVWDLAIPSENSSSPTAERMPLKADRLTSEAIQTGLVRAVHQTLRKVGADYESFRFNTAISALMELCNLMQKERLSVEGSPEWANGVETLLLMLAPITPYIAEELWHRRGQTRSIHLESWPEYDNRLATDLTAKVVVQVNGKLRDTLEVPKGMDQASLEEMARTSPNVIRTLTGQEVGKVVFISDRLINFVTI